jgi:hypothetical protein
MKSTITAAVALALAAGSALTAAPAVAKPHITFIATPVASTERTYVRPEINVRFTGVNSPRVANEWLFFRLRAGYTIKLGYARSVLVAFHYPIEDPFSPIGPLVLAPGQLVKNQFTQERLRRLPGAWFEYRISARELSKTPHLDPVAMCQAKGARDGGPSFDLDGAVMVSLIVLAKDDRGHTQRKIRRATHLVKIKCDPAKFRSGQVAGGTRTTPKKPNPEGSVISARAEVLNNGTRRCPTQSHLRLTVETFNLGTVWYRVRRQSDNHAFAPGQLTGRDVRHQRNRRFTFVHLITSEVRQTHTDAYRIEVLKRVYDARAGRHRFGVVMTSKWSRARIFCQRGPQLGTPGTPRRPGFRNRG